MKAIFLFLVFVIGMASMPAIADIGPVNRSTNVDYAGAIVSGSLEVKYINVINALGSAIAAGKVVTPDLTADNGASVTASATAGLSPLCIMVKSCAIGALCLCQTYGYYSAALFDSTGNNAAAGARWYMSSANAGYVSARGTSLATEVPGGIFYDAATASGSVEVFIGIGK